jgi:Protein of unknown function (DUF1688)
LPLDISAAMSVVRQSAVRLTSNTMSIAERTTAPLAVDLAKLRSAAAVRERCRLVQHWVAAGRSPHFTLDETRLADVARYVAVETRAAYPDLKIPPHSRWRHFTAGGIDRWALIEQKLAGIAANDRARVAIDLAMVSVLLDAGAGDQWRYREHATGLVFARSEGLAIASFEMFAKGIFSSDPARPLQVEATALKVMDSAKLAQYFQIDADNPLIGLEHRANLLRRLGHALNAWPDLFGAVGRPGHLADHLARLHSGGRVPAPVILRTLLESLSLIWPSGLTVDGVSVGDAGRHPAIRTGDATDGIVPFHKLSQWLTYSLIEPLAIAGVTVVDLDGMTALAEYRNGGLLVDLGVIRPRLPIGAPLEVSSELVVEWRALTVTLMDELLDVVRASLNLDTAFALPHLLQGGTWSAGRKIARELRPPTGPSPIPVVTDGTVF